MMNPSYDPGSFFERISVPDGWDNVESFADWYMSVGAPPMVPWDAEIIASDDATAVCLFTAPT
jgi:hypothetical protein